MVGNAIPHGVPACADNRLRGSLQFGHPCCLPRIAGVAVGNLPFGTAITLAKTVLAMVTIDSPYRDQGTWLRGNVHTHSTNSDGIRDPQDVANDYAARGYDFLAISDHDTFTHPEEYETAALIEIPAVEVSVNGPHILHLGATTAVEPDADRAAVLQSISETEGFAVPAHPNWEPHFDHWPQDELSRIDGYTGIEIYNGLVEHHPGAAIATDRWDQLLSAGRRVWGFANDDSHRPWDVANGWNVVQVDEPTRESVLAALSGGRFYASTGITITAISTSDGIVTIDTENADEIRLVSDHGVIQQIVSGTEATFRVPEQLVHAGPEFTYIRLECYGRGNERAWTQPMFLE